MNAKIFWSAVCAGLLVGAPALRSQDSTTTAQPSETQTQPRQPQTSPAPSAPTPATEQTISSSPSQPTSESTTRSADEAQPAAAQPTEDTDTPRRRVAESVTGSGDDEPNIRDCTRLRGLEKSECERRDTTRDDLPAGVTSTQKPAQ